MERFLDEFRAAERRSRGWPQIAFPIRACTIFIRGKVRVDNNRAGGSAIPVFPGRFRARADDYHVAPPRGRRHIILSPLVRESSIRIQINLTSPLVNQAA